MSEKMANKFNKATKLSGQKKLLWYGKNIIT